MAFEVAKGVPMPGKGRTGRRVKYPFPTMEVGDSFAVPVTLKTRVKIQSTVSRSAGQWAKRSGNGHRFSVRLSDSECRCWRVA